jgi:hypothetical protein
MLIVLIKIDKSTWEFSNLIIMLDFLVITNIVIVDVNRDEHI